MKQIKFGSFPLCEISNEDRKCLDKYILKHFSDQISFNDVMSNMNNLKNNIYISPYSIVKYIREIKGTSPTSNSLTINNAPDYFSNNINLYTDVMKRSFHIMKSFYLKLSNSPFYKEHVYYPIYIEKVIDTGNVKKLGSKTEKPNMSRLNIQTEYNFILLSDGLLSRDIDNLKINEAGVINALYIYIHLFHPDLFMSMNMDYSVPAGRGISSLNNDDLVLIMRFYKLITKHNMNPVSLFFSIISLIKEAENILNNNPDISRKSFRSRVARTGSGLLKNKILKTKLDRMAKIVSNDIFNSRNINRELSDAERRRRTATMLKAISAILDDSEIYDFVDNLNHNRRSKESRIQAVADYHKYNDIIKILETLIKFNNLNLNEIITDSDIDFSKDISLTEIHDDTANYFKLEGAINKQFFDDQFSLFIKDISVYIHTLSNRIIKEQINRSIMAAQNDNPNVQQVNRLVTQLNNLNIQREDIIRQRTELANRLNPLLANSANLSNDELNSLRELQNRDNSLERELYNIDAKERDINDQILLINSYQGTNPSAFLSSLGINSYNTKERTLDSISGEGLNDIISNNINRNINIKNGQGFNNNNNNNNQSDVSLLNHMKIRMLENIDSSMAFLYDDLLNTFLSPIILLELFRPTGEFTLRNFPSSPNDLEHTLDHVRNLHNTENLIAIQYRKLDSDIDMLVENMLQELNVILGEVVTSVPNPGNNGNDLDNLNGPNPSQFDMTKIISDLNHIDPDTKIKLRKRIINILFYKIFAPFKNYLSKIKLNSESPVTYSNKLNILHPILGKLARNINNFKIYIFNTEVLGTLYDLIYNTQELMFLNGLVNKPPKKLNSPELKSKYVLKNALGLQQNPTWVIGQGKLRLNLPDYLALTGEPLESSIPSSELKNICKVDFKKFWDMTTTADLFSNDDQKTEKLDQEINALNTKINDIRSSNDPNKMVRIKDLREAIKELEEKRDMKKLNSGVGNVGKNLGSTKDEFQDFKKKYKLNIDELMNNDQERSFFDQLRPQENLSMQPTQHQTPQVSQVSRQPSVNDYRQSLIFNRFNSNNLNNSNNQYQNRTTI